MPLRASLGELVVLPNGRMLLKLRYRTESGLFGTPS